MAPTTYPYAIYRDVLARELSQPCFKYSREKMHQEGMINHRQVFLFLVGHIKLYAHQKLVKMSDAKVIGSNSENK